MRGIGLAASANWYFPKVCDCSQEGLFAYGARGDVILLDISCSPPEYRGLLPGDTERVAGVCFDRSPHSTGELVSASESGILRVWDTVTGVSVREIPHNKARLICTDWSTRNPRRVASGDEKGVLYIDDPKGENETKSYRMNKLPILCLAFSPHDLTTLAIGFRGGLILTVNIEHECTKVHFLRRHDEDIHGLVWSPPSCVDRGAQGDNAEVNDQCLLVSSSRDTYINVWNGNTGQRIGSSKLPSPYKRNRYKDDRNQKGRVWMSLYWPSSTPRTFWCGGHGGEMLVCDINKGGRPSMKSVYHSQSHNHNRLIFGIAGYKNIACTISMDRQMIIWNLETKTSQSCIPTIGGFVYSIKFSPVDPAFLGIGTGDNQLRVWMTKPDSSPYKIYSYWQGVRSKVTSVCWHPTIEGRLAFGTEEGRVGIYNMLNSKPPAISETDHKGTVYTIGWGPDVTQLNIKDESNRDLVLYSCGQGLIFIHDPRDLHKEAKDLNKLLKDRNPDLKLSYRSDFGWKNDKRLLVVGNDDGLVEIFSSPDLKRLIVIAELRKVVESLRWHPEFVTSSSLKSECEGWLAATCLGDSIFIYDLNKAIEEASTTKEEVSMTQALVVLSGHKSRIVDMCWSPHISGQIVSASYDGSAQVWDAKTGTPLANFQGHCGRVLCVEWSLLDPDLIFSGADDFTIQQWKISEQTETRPPTHKRNRQREMKIRGSPQVSDSEETAPTVVAEIADLLERKRREIVEKSVLEVSSKPTETGATNGLAPKAALEDELASLRSASPYLEKKPPLGASSKTKQNTDKKKKPRKPTKCLFLKSSSLENRGKQYTLHDIERIAEAVKLQQQQQSLSADAIFSAINGELDDAQVDDKAEDLTQAGFDMTLGSGDTAHLGYFGSRVNVFNTLKAESDHHVSNENVDLAHQLDIWKGNTGLAVRKAIEHGTLNANLVSLAPMGSMDLWRSACRSYAQQLMKAGDHRDAVLYLLAIQEIHQAIDVLKTHVGIREALALAKVRLSPTDAKITELMNEWTAKAMQEANFELAAKCHLSLGHFQQASEVLARRNDPWSLSTAAKLSLLNNDAVKATTLARESVTKFLVANNWTDAQSVVMQYPQLEVFKLVLIAHQVLHDHFQRLAREDDLWCVQPLGDVASLKIWLPCVVTDNLRPILNYVLDQWTIDNVLDRGNQEKISSLYQKMDQFDRGWQHVNNLQQITLRASYLVCKALLSAASSSTLLYLKSLVELLAFAHESQHKQIFESLTRLILPYGIDLDNLLLSKADKEKAESKSFLVYSESLKAFYSLAVLEWLNEFGQVSFDAFVEAKEVTEAQEEQKETGRLEGEEKGATGATSSLPEEARGATGGVEAVAEKEGETESLVGAKGNLTEVFADNRSTEGKEVSTSAIPEKTLETTEPSAVSPVDSGLNKTEDGNLSSVPDSQYPETVKEVGILQKQNSESSDIPFMDSVETVSDVEEIVTQVSKDELVIRELMKHLLSDRQAEKRVLEMQLESVNKALIYQNVREKIRSMQKVDAAIDNEARGGQKPVENIPEGNVEEGVFGKDDEVLKKEIKAKVEENEVKEAKEAIGGSAAVATEAGTTVGSEEVAKTAEEQQPSTPSSDARVKQDSMTSNDGSGQADSVSDEKPGNAGVENDVAENDAVAEKRRLFLEKNPSVCTSENTEKTLDFDDNMERLLTEDEITSDSQTVVCGDEDGGAAVAVDYSLPFDKRYNKEGIPRETLQREKQKIEADLELYDLLDCEFPNPLSSARLLIAYCGAKMMPDLMQEIETWLKDKESVLAGSRKF